MRHIFFKGKTNKPTFLLLHGTGGNEKDLLPIVEKIDKEASYLSIRGNVLEDGMNRFFRRIEEEVFDEEDLILRTEELNQFLDEAAIKYGFDRHNIIAIGYSNGADIAASLLFHFKSSLKGAILHHPMVPRKGVELPDLSGKTIFISAGTNDPICSPLESFELCSILRKANAKVHLHWVNKGHQLTEKEIRLAAQWYQNLQVVKKTKK